MAYERIGGFTARRLPLPAGDAGTRMTLEHMQRMAIEGSKDLEVRSAAVEALDRYGAPAHAPFAALGAIHRYIQDRIRFVPDPVGAQMVQSPRATLEYRAGNCAQRATLLASMARAVGVPASLRYRVAALNPQHPRSFSHVYVVADAGGREIALDPTFAGSPPGFEHPRPYRRGDFPVYQQVKPCRSIACYSLMEPTLGWNPLKSLVKVVKKVALPAAMFATKFLPGGIVVSTAAKLALSKAGSGGSGAGISAFASRSGLAQRVATRAAAIRAAQATPITQVSPATAAMMVSSPTMSAEAQPISQSQVASAAAGNGASETATTPPTGMSPMVPLLVLGGALLLLGSSRKRG